MNNSNAKREMYLYSWSKDEFNYDIVIKLGDDGKSIVGLRKSSGLIINSEKAETLEKAFIYTVKKYIKMCNGMKFRDAKEKITGNKTFIEMCNVFGDSLVSISTGGRR